MEITRRKFMTATAAAVIVGGMKASGRVWGANDRINMATIGFNGQGRTHIGDLLGDKDKLGIQYTALCDVDERVLRAGAKMVEKAQGTAPKTYADMRELMQDPDVDAITIATPNHWHTLATVWGCQAGKDVYVEKPAAHSVYEAQQVALAAKKYNRIVQHGTQSRCDPTLIRDMKLLHDGSVIGKVMHSRGVVYKNGNRNSIGKGVEGTPPEALNYELWQGPAKDVPYKVRADRETQGLWVHYNWHWFWQWGNGEIGNQGVHEMDIACWGHNRGLPVKIMSQGGRYGWDDDAETPNTQASSFTFDDGSLLTFEVRNLGSFEEADAGDCTNSFFGTDGYYVRSKGFFDYKKKDDQPVAIPVAEAAPEKLSKWEHFIKAVRSRDNNDNPADMEKAKTSSAMCALGNVAYQLGRSLNFDPATETFGEDAEANAHLKREYREGFEVPQIA